MIDFRLAAFALHRVRLRGIFFEQLAGTEHAGETEVFQFVDAWDIKHVRAAAETGIIRDKTGADHFTPPGNCKSVHTDILNNISFFPEPTYRSKSDLHVGYCLIIGLFPPAQIDAGELHGYENTSDEDLMLISMDLPA